MWPYSKAKLPPSSNCTLGCCQLHELGQFLHLVRLLERLGLGLLLCIAAARGASSYILRGYTNTLQRQQC